MQQDAKNKQQSEDKEEAKKQVVQTVVKKAGKGKATLAQIKAIQKQREEQNKQLAEAQEKRRIQEAKRQRAAEAARLEAEKKEEEAKEVKKTMNQLRRFNFGNKQSKSSERYGVVKEEKKVEENKVQETGLKSSICCVLGHVDTGKTKLLDKLRESDVQGGEAGGITQQIGATYFPIEVLSKKYDIKSTDIPGILVIDTPGHESFSNLRSRGSSLCNLAVLVVDILHGLEPQTIESIQLLRSKKTPFVVALNKIDRIYDWKRSEAKNVSFQDLLVSQEKHTQSEFESLTNSVISQFAGENLNAELWYKNSDPRKVLSLVPLSAVSGEGICDLISLIISLTTKFMSNKIRISNKTECTILEVKHAEGFGVTLDAILNNGYLSEGDKIALSGSEGPIFTSIKTLLVPQPLKELRIKSQYATVKEIRAVAGIKIIAHGVDTALAGSRLLVLGSTPNANCSSEEDAKRELSEDIAGCSSYNFVDEGIAVCASTLGSLEALLSFLSQYNLPISTTSLGRIRKMDIVRASLAKEQVHRVILCFNVKVDSELSSYAEQLGVKIFTAEIIYHLLRKYQEYSADTISSAKAKHSNIAVFPVLLQIVPKCVFNSRSPLVLGVEVMKGSLKLNTPLCVLKDDDVVHLGRVTSIEDNKKVVSQASKGSKVAVKIEVGRNDTPKMFGRHFDYSDLIYSFHNRECIDTVKKYFSDELDEECLDLLDHIETKFRII